MSSVIQVIDAVPPPGYERKRPSEHAGRYVKAFAANAGRIGIGELETTDRIDEALHFPDAAAATEFYRQVDTREPERPWDGRPNRPLTAYTVLIVPLKAETHGRA